MTHRLASLGGGALATVALAASPAYAATVNTGLDCYSSGARGSFSGAGYTPGASYLARISTGASDRGTVAADGSISGNFGAPRISSGERNVRLTITQGGTRATTTFTSTSFEARYDPQSGNPATLRVRFRVFGYGPPNRAIYLHYIRPSGRLRATVRLGRTVGRCGRLTSARRRIFPFTAEAGNWRLRFDTRATYSRRARAPYYTLRVPIITSRR